MTILIFGVAISPIFNNGLIYAQNDNTNYTEEEKREQRSNESKQQKAEQIARAEERAQTSKEKYEEDSEVKQQKREDKLKRETEEQKQGDNLEETKEQKRHKLQERRTASQELQEQRKAELVEKKRILVERLAEAERIDRERMQERLDRLENRSPMTDAMNMLIDAGVLEPTEEIISEPEPILAPTTDNIPYLGSATDSTTITEVLDQQNTIPPQTGVYFDELRETFAEQERQQTMLFRQLNTLLNLVDSMCEGKVLVAGVSDGVLSCIDSDRAFSLHSRGLVTLVE